MAKTNEFAELQEYEIPDEELFSYFGLTDDPFGFVLLTEDAAACRQAILRAQQRGKMLAIVGDVGSGKTTLLNLLAEQPGLKLVRADFVDQSSCSPAALVETMIRQLRYDDRWGPIPHSQARRQHELSQLLHRHREGGETIVLALDDGQDFRPGTLRILKRLREFSYYGRDRLFEVLVLTHTSGADRLLQIEEIGRRFVTRRMAGFSAAELRAYVTRAMEGLFAGDQVIDEFCALCPDRRPLVVQGTLLQALGRAMLRGGRQIEAQDLEQGLGITAQLRRYNISLQMVADRAGVGKTTVHQVLRGNYRGTTDRMQSVLRTAREAIGDAQRETRAQVMREARQAG